MKQLIYIFLLILATACHKKDYDIINLNNNRIGVLGHAGMGMSSPYPINSFESITNCLSLGADGTEIDVQLTSDGVLVAFHDGELNASTNKNGIINNKTWAELEGAYYDLIPYYDYQVITLESVFVHTENPSQYTFSLDCKLHTDHPGEAYIQQFSSALIKLLTKYQLSEKIIIESPDPKLLIALNQQSVPYLLFLNIKYLETALMEAGQWPIDGFILANERVSKEEIDQAHQQGYKVALFNTRSKGENIDAIEKNPDYIQTDRLKHLLRELNR